MPQLDNLPDAQQLVKVLNIGFSKAGKTHWTMQAAEQGFRLIFLDGDRSLATLNALSPEAKKRVFYVDCHDTAGRARFATIVNNMFTSPVFTWNDTKQQQVAPSQQPEVGDTIWEIRLDQVDSRDILVIDTWTSLSYSWLSDAAGGAINLTNEKIDRGVYAASGNRATWALNLLCSVLKCHVVVNGHPDEFQKLRNPEGKLKNQTETDKIVEWTRSIPASVSKPHGSRMAKHFTDVLNHRITAGRDRKIDSRSFDDEDGGGVWNDFEAASKRTFSDLAKARGVTLPGKDAPFSNAITVYEWTEERASGGVKGPVKQVATPVTGGTVKVAMPTVIPGSKADGEVNPVKPKMPVGIAALMKK